MGKKVNENEKKGMVYVYQKISFDKYKYIGMGDCNFASMRLESG